MLTRQKEGWHDEPNNEQDIYQALAPLQKTVVPISYGEAKFTRTETTRTRALEVLPMWGESEGVVVLILAREEATVTGIFVSIWFNLNIQLRQHRPGLNCNTS